MTYIEQIAKMLDVEINEEFKIEGYDDNMRFKFTSNAFLQSCGDGWWSSSNSIMCVLEGDRKLIKLPKFVLTDEEKEYLSYVIKPFRNEIDYIYKCSTYRGEKEYIAISFKKITRDMFFPEYPTGTMYKGMIRNKEYSLDELGL